jgi:hypothetical protein
VILKSAALLLLSLGISSSVWAEDKPQNKKVDKKIKVEKTETLNHNIKIDASAESGHKDHKFFCAPTLAEAQKDCEKWVADQRKSLKDRLLTSSCKRPRFLGGQKEEGCMAYLGEGEVSFVLNKK